MSRIINASICLDKLDKSKITTGKNGAKYYNLSIIVNDTTDQYGNDVSITETQSKEDRAAKAKRVFIGNGKTVFNSEPKAETKTTGNDDFSDLPF